MKDLIIDKNKSIDLEIGEYEKNKVVSIELGFLASKLLPGLSNENRNILIDKIFEALKEIENDRN